MIPILRNPILAKRRQCIEHLAFTRLPEGVRPPSFELGFGVLAPRLFRLDRYERRALSRRKTAIRRLEELEELDVSFPLKPLTEASP
jgi:hypothetical protein